MKHLWIITTLLAALLIAQTAWADGYTIDAQSKEKIQLDVTMRFNAVEPALAIRIMDQLRQWYGPDGDTSTACKLKYTLEKVGNGDGGYVTITEAAATYTIFNDPCYDSEETARRQCDDGYRDTGSQPGRYCCK